MHGPALIAAAIALALSAAGAADAKPKHKRPQHAHAAGWHCPPGLAKKNPPCVPPGQARKHDRHHGSYRVGDRIRDGYVLVPDPWRYGHRDPGTYWRVGDQLFRVDRETGEVLAALGVIAALLD